jgi:hypothetical protein
VDALTFVIVIVIGILPALILWNGGAFILKAWFILTCALGRCTFGTPTSSLLLAIAGLALLVLVTEPAHKERQ